MNVRVSKDSPNFVNWESYVSPLEYSAYIQKWNTIRNTFHRCGNFDALLEAVNENDKVPDDIRKFVQITLTTDVEEGEYAHIKGRMNPKIFYWWLYGYLPDIKDLKKVNWFNREILMTPKVLQVKCCEFMAWHCLIEKENADSHTLKRWYWEITKPNGDKTEVSLETKHIEIGQILPTGYYKYINAKRCYFSEIANNFFRESYIK